MLGSVNMSNLVQHAWPVLLAGGLLTSAVGCTSLTRSDEVKINKDVPVSPLAEPEPPPAPAEPPPDLQGMRNPEEAPPPRKAGTG